MLFALLDVFLERIPVLEPLTQGESTLAYARVMGVWLALALIATAVLRALAVDRLSGAGALAIVLWEELFCDSPLIFLSSPDPPKEVWDEGRWVLALGSAAMIWLLLRRDWEGPPWLPLRGRWLRTLIAALTLFALAYSSLWGWLATVVLEFSNPFGGTAGPLGPAAMAGVGGVGLILLAITGRCLVTRRFGPAPTPPRKDEACPAGCIE